MMFAALLKCLAKAYLPNKSCDPHLKMVWQCGDGVLLINKVRQKRGQSEVRAIKARKSTTTGPGDDEVRLLLDRYNCPIPFHEVRTRFLGNIASPALSSPPIETVKGLWGGELPPLDDINAANELIGALVMGLWNKPAR